MAEGERKLTPNEEAFYRQLARSRKTNFNPPAGKPGGGSGARSQPAQKPKNTPGPEPEGFLMRIYRALGGK